jgi:hypothetical protein
LAPVPAAAETYSIFANHGNGWINHGGHSTLAGCKLEAAGLSASFPQAQFGCLGATAVRAYEFQQATARCARRSGVEHNPKPGSRVQILGTAQERFDFDKCMTKAGHDLQSTP